MSQSHINKRSSVDDDRQSQDSYRDTATVPTRERYHIPEPISQPRSRKFSHRPSQPDLLTEHRSRHAPRARHPSTLSKRPRSTSPKLTASPYEQRRMERSHSPAEEGSKSSARLASSDPSNPDAMLRPVGHSSPRITPLATGTMSSGNVSRRSARQSQKSAVRQQSQLESSSSGRRPNQTQPTAQDLRLVTNDPDSSRPQQESQIHDGRVRGPKNLTSPSQQIRRTKPAMSTPTSADDLQNSPASTQPPNSKSEPARTQSDSSSPRRVRSTKREKLKDILKSLHLWQQDPDGSVRSQRTREDAASSEQDVEHIVVRHWTEQN